MKREESHQHKSRSRRQLNAVGEQLEAKQAQLAALMAQEEQLAVRVKGKPRVYDQIEADREARAKPKNKCVSPAAGTACWQKLQTTRHHTSEGLSPTVASARAPAAASPADDVVEVFEYESRWYIRAGLAEQRMVPKEKAEGAETLRVRQELYGNQVDEEGSFRPGRR